MGGEVRYTVADAIVGRMASHREAVYVHGVNVARSSGLPAARINIDKRFQSLSSREVIRYRSIGVDAVGYQKTEARHPALTEG